MIAWKLPNFVATHEACTSGIRGRPCADALLVVIVGWWAEMLLDACSVDFPAELFKRRTWPIVFIYTRRGRCSVCRNGMFPPLKLLNVPGLVSTLRLRSEVSHLFGVIRLRNDICRRLQWSKKRRVPSSDDSETSKFRPGIVAAIYSLKPRWLCISATVASDSLFQLL